jgi:copper resistance protein B
MSIVIERVPGRAHVGRRFCMILCVTLGRGALGADGVPDVTEADRAAAFPDLSGTPMHQHMHEDPLIGMLRAEEFEWQGRSADDALKWDVTGWLGHDMNRLWLRDEGEHVGGESVENRLELLWGRPVAPWWDVVGGARLDTGTGPSRAYGAFGVQGIAPQWIHVEATAYVGDGAQIGVRLQADHDWLISNRAILSARIEGAAWGDDDADAGIGSGLADVSAGLRLRYEIRREFAPYAGIEWSGLLGDTADLARAAGEDIRDTHLVAGLRFWF